MDEDNAWAHADGVALGQAVRDHLGERTRAWLAEQLDVDPAWVTRLIQGKQRSLTLEQLAAVERVLGLRRGTLFYAADVVDPVTTTVEAIEADRALRASAKHSLKVLYEGLRQTQ